MADKDPRLESLERQESRARPIAERGRRAKAILDDEIVKEAFAELEGHILETFKETSPEEAAKLQEIRREWGSMKLFRAVFERHVRHGSVAEKEIGIIVKQRKSIAERKRRK